MIILIETALRTAAIALSMATMSEFFAAGAVDAMRLAASNRPVGLHSNDTGRAEANLRQKLQSKAARESIQERSYTVTS